ncbi:hypothetical protein [Actinoplanes sp. NPDC026670]|uniref:hypothetical protein n=1 Tax=Actinoplanes sp. NPDC026670 TaxID=3154700 RepID=UPI0034099F19
MSFQRLAAASVTIAAIVGLGACSSGSQNSGSTGAAPVATTTAAATPVEEFVAASKKLGTETMKMKMVMPGGIEATGSADLANKKLDMTMKMSMGTESLDIAVRLVGETMYMKMGPTGDKWMSLDVSKLPKGNSLNPENLANAEAFAAAAVDVKLDGDNFSGTLDMTKSPTADPESLKALGAKATAVPFTAKRDSEGRLTELVIDMSGMGAGSGKITTTYYDFGTKVDVAAPAASEITPMPEDMLKAFTSQGQTAGA